MRHQRICARSTCAAWKYRRRVGADGTVRVAATVLQLPGLGGRSLAGRYVELQLRLDGRLVAWDGRRELVVRAAPPDPVQLRALGRARVQLGTLAPSAGSPVVRPDHPWRRVATNKKLYRQRQQERRLTESVSS